MGKAIAVDSLVRAVGHGVVESLQEGHLISLSLGGWHLFTAGLSLLHMLDYSSLFLKNKKTQRIQCFSRGNFHHRRLACNRPKPAAFFLFECDVQSDT